MLVTFRWNRKPRLAEPVLFSSLSLPRRRRWPVFLISGLIHGTCLFLVSSVSDILFTVARDDWMQKQLSRPSLIIKMPARLYLASSNPEPEKKRAPAPESKSKSVIRAIAKARPQEEAPKPEAPSKPAPRKFELPPLKRLTAAEQTVLQPQYPPELPLQAQRPLPQILFWAAALHLPRPAPKPFVAPGRTEPTPVILALDAPPKLEMPRPESSPTKVVSTGMRGLSLPPPSPPIRVFTPPSPQAQPNASVDVFRGDPANVLIISSATLPLTASVVIPAGNQLAHLPGPPGQSSKFTSDRSTGPSGGGNNPTGTGGGSGPSGSGAGNGSGSGGNVVTLGTSPGGNGPGGSGNLVALARPNLAAVPAKQLRPNVGVFDVVVIQSSNSEVFSESAGALTGRPIYTVYVRVSGMARDWIMQYCVPNSTEARKHLASLFGLEGTAPVKAPYPLIQTRPPASLLEEAGDMVLHGFVESDGRLADLKLVRGGTPRTAKVLLSYVDSWDFLPAVRDGIPMRVEILLVVPPAQGNRSKALETLPE